MEIEISALRHQLNVLRRSIRRPKLRSADRWFWICLSCFWTNWRSALIIVKPETVLAWHRQGFRLYWAWKSRHRRGRPGVSPEIKKLIRTISQANPLWGAPRIHGKLLKLGIDVSQATVSRYIHRTVKPPSQTVPTVWFQILFGFVAQQTLP